MNFEVSSNSTKVPLDQRVSWLHCSQTQTNQDCSVTTLTWGTRASLVRSWCKGTWARSWPSITTRPPVGSTMRKRVLIRVDLPHPVRPTMPIFSRGLMLRLNPFSTRSRSSLYRTYSSQHIRRSGECCKECTGQSKSNSRMISSAWSHSVQYRLRTVV